MGIIKDIKFYFQKIKQVNQLKKLYPKKEVKLPALSRKPLSFNCSTTPKVSIIIPFYNQEAYTYNCLEYIEKYLPISISYEILLIDDNSSEEYDFSAITGISLLKNEQNLGFLRSVNEGIKASKGEFVYLLNNDTEVQENFLTELLYVFENFENVGAVGSMLLNADNTLQECGALFLKDCDINLIVKREVFYPEVNFISEVDYCSGCSLLFKKNKDNGDLNLLDDNFAPAYFEETDLCFDLKYNQGKKIYYTPFSKVLHFNGVSYNSNINEDKLKKKEFLYNTNKSKFIEKWWNQINSIKAQTIEERLVEIKNHKSILFVSGIVPEYDKDSGSNRLKEILLAYVKLGYKVGFCSINNSYDNEYNTFFQRHGIEVFYIHRKDQDYLKFIKKNYHDTKYVWYYGPNTFYKLYNTISKLTPHSRSIYDMVDVHHLRYEKALELEPNKASIKKKHKKYLKIETEHSQKADYVVSISDIERKYISKFIDEKKLITISNIHYPKINKNDIIPFEERKDILFIGSVHTPNVDAVYYLFNDIMPLVWKKTPDCKVHILGSVNKSINDISHPNIIFHGYVPEVDSFFNNTKLMVAPLRYGGGVKGKVGQAFEYYLPIVTTSVGAEGMHLKDGINAIITDDTKDFAEGIYKLYTDENCWKQFSSNSEISLYPFSREKLYETIKSIN